MHVPESPQNLPLRTCTGSCNDLWEQISPRSAQDFLIRACRKSCQDLWQHIRMIFITSAHKELYKTLVKIFIYYEPLRLDCETIARSSYNNLPQNSWNPFFRISGTQLKSSPHHNESNPTGTEWREACASNDKSRTAPQRDRSDTHKGDERVEMHMDISEGNFGAIILNEEAGGNRAYPDQTRPFTPTVRTPQCGHTVWSVWGKHISY